MSDYNRENVNPQREIDRCNESIESCNRRIENYRDEIVHLESNINVLDYFIDNEKSLGDTVSEITLKMNNKTAKMTIKAGKTTHIFEFASSKELLTAMFDTNIDRVRTIVKSLVDFKEEEIQDEYSDIEGYRREITRYEDMKKTQLFDENDPKSGVSSITISSENGEIGTIGKKKNVDKQEPQIENVVTKDGEVKAVDVSTGEVKEEGYTELS